MKITLDTVEGGLTVDGAAMDLYSKEGFEALSEAWLKVGWNQKYTYTFSWMGRPMIQLPEDMLRTQEVVHAVQPDVLIECGVAHGGSLVFFASLFEAMGKGKVVGVDIEIRPHNRAAIEAHPLFKRIDLIEGSSTEPSIVSEAKSHIKEGDTVLVFLDSDHSKGHVLDELRAYADVVTPGSYIVATDGCMEYLTDVPRGKKEWAEDNPVEAVKQFLQEDDRFVLEQPDWPFNESELTENLTHWPSAWLRRKDS